MENRHRMDVAELDDRDCEGSVCEGNEPNLDGDKLNVVLLTLLCTLQGIPMGISLAISTYMQNMKVSYVQQAKFSMVDLPYSLKLLWAPLVDAAYSERIGKRKTWLIPVQLIIGLALMFVGSNLDHWLVSNNPHMTTLTCVFFCVNALAATQDIAIDGWALTMLKRENVGYASLCNTSGQALGIAIGYVFFILLESEVFCNKWLRLTDQQGGIVSMEGYLYFWGIIFLGATLALALFKQEKCDQSDKLSRMTITHTYKLLWKIVNLQTMKKFALVMLTYEIAFSSIGSSVSNPKFLEYGIAKEDIALVDMSLIPIKIFIPILISKYTTGPRPLKVFYKTVSYRLVLLVTSAGLVYYTPYFVDDEDSNVSIYFFLIYELHRVSRMVLSVIIYLGVQSFFSRISDPRIGGTYMSLMNTLWYFGMATAKIAALGMLNSLTVRRCSTDDTNMCASKHSTKACEHNDDGECVTVIDGYFIEVGVCTMFGIGWCLFLKKMLKKLESKRLCEWQVNDDEPAAMPEDNVVGELPDLIGGPVATLKNAKLAGIENPP